MKQFPFIPLFLWLACIFSSACRSVESNGSILHVPSGYYRIVGEVKYPGLKLCGKSNKTLNVLISDAGGFTDYAYTKKILVIHSGVTNTFDYKKIYNKDIEDPLVICGSVVQVQRIAPF